MIRALKLTYTVEVPDGTSDDDCKKIRDLYKFSLLKNARRMEAVTSSIKKHMGIQGAKLTTEVED